MHAYAVVGDRTVDSLNHFVMSQHVQNHPEGSLASSYLDSDDESIECGDYFEDFGLQHVVKESNSITPRTELPHV